MTKRQNQTPESFSVGQLAKRWGVSPDRVRRLIDAGHIPTAFRIPSAGRFGTTLKIPRTVIEQLETDWQVSPEQPHRRRNPTSALALRHLTAIIDHSESGVECRGADRD